MNGFNGFNGIDVVSQYANPQWSDMPGILLGSAPLLLLIALSIGVIVSYRSLVNQMTDTK